jgi:beta-lactamase superfamily II metal-dependent hydrolase
MHRKFSLLFVLVFSANSFAQVLQVKPDKIAIIKSEPSGSGSEVKRLLAGTKVKQLGEVGLYYSIQMSDCSTGYSYKGNYSASSSAWTSCSGAATMVTGESLLSRTDVLQIIVLDVEVGDATLIICPSENGTRDILLIDTGENDADRIKLELTKRGFQLGNKPITRFYVTHYDYDHVGASPDIVPLSQVIYDHGNNNIKDYYMQAVSPSSVDRRRMTLDYNEVFSGGVTVECVAVNQATDFNTDRTPDTEGDNPNSIALIVSYEGFDYFTAGDLTGDRAIAPERSLAAAIRNCDAYHVDHHGSKATSSYQDFIVKLDPEVSIASNGTKHGHPTKDVADRLIALGSGFYQTNINPFDPRANNPDAKFVADDSYNEDGDREESDGAIGNIQIVVAPMMGKYYIIMNGLPLSEATFTIER